MTTIHNLNCSVCSVTFESARNGILYCSDHCRKEQKRIRDITYGRKIGKKPAHRIQMHACTYCAKQYKPKNGNRITYCSRECSFTHKSEGREHKELVAAEIQGIKRLRSNAIIARNRRERDALMKRVNRCTAGCGRITHIGTYPKRCDTCIRDNKNEYISNARKQGKMPGGSCRSRAKHYGVKYEPVKPIEIAMKYGMRCALCKVSTPWSRRGTRHNNAPEIDHITPISKGGDHVADNLQLLCLKCNAEKSNNNQMGQHAFDL